MCHPGIDNDGTVKDMDLLDKGGDRKDVFFYQVGCAVEAFPPRADLIGSAPAQSPAQRTIHILSVSLCGRLMTSTTFRVRS
jgi:hypothetical protein